MNDFTFQCPTRFVFGRQALDQVGDALAERGFSHALVVYLWSFFFFLIAELHYCADAPRMIHTYSSTALDVW